MNLHIKRIPIFVKKNMLDALNKDYVDALLCTEMLTTIKSSFFLLGFLWLFSFYNNTFLVKDMC